MPESDESFFREIVERARAGICVVKGDDIEYSNETLLEMTGYSREDLIGKHAGFFIHPEDRERVFRARDKVLSEGKGRERLDLRCILRNGQVINSEWLLVRITFKGVPSLACFLLDTTESTWELSQLRQFADIISKMKSGFYVYRMENLYDDSSFVMINANPAATISLGIERNKLIGKRIDKCFPGLREKGVPQRFAEVVRTGIPFEIEDFSYGDENVKQSHFSLRAFSVPDNCVCVIFEDITEKRSAEIALEKTILSLKKAQKFSQVGSWTWKIKTGSLEWSDEMYSIFGIEKGKFTGNLAEVIARAIHPDDRAKVDASNQSVIKEKKPVPLEYRITWPDGQVRTVWAEAGELILDGEGNPEELSGFVQDITEKKRAESHALETAYLLEKAQEVTGFGVFGIDIGSGKVSLSGKMRALFGIAETEEVRVETLLSKVSEGERLMAGSILNRAIELPDAVGFSFSTVPIGGISKKMRTHGKTVFEEGKPAKLIGVIFEEKALD